MVAKLVGALFFIGFVLFFGLATSASTEKSIGGEDCQYDSACQSNSCIEGKCTELGIFQKIGNWFKRTFGLKDSPQITIQKTQNTSPPTTQDTQPQNRSPQTMSNDSFIVEGFGAISSSPSSTTCKYEPLKVGNFSGITGDEACQSLGYTSCGFIREFKGATYYSSNDRSCSKFGVQSFDFRDIFKECDDKINYGRSICSGSSGEEPILGDVSSVERTIGVFCCK